MFNLKCSQFCPLRFLKTFLAKKNLAQYYHIFTYAVVGNSVIFTRFYPKLNYVENLVKIPI